MKTINLVLQHRVKLILMILYFSGAPPDDVKDLREQLKNLNTELIHLEETLQQQTQSVSEAGR